MNVEKCYTCDGNIKSRLCWHTDFLLFLIHFFYLVNSRGEQSKIDLDLDLLCRLKVDWLITGCDLFKSRQAVEWNFHIKEIFSDGKEINVIYTTEILQFIWEIKLIPFRSHCISRFLKNTSNEGFSWMFMKTARVFSITTIMIQIWFHSWSDIARGGLTRQQFSPKSLKIKIFTYLWAQCTS